MVNMLQYRYPEHRAERPSRPHSVADLSDVIEMLLSVHATEYFETGSLL
jgi:hypothetical protein